MFFQSIPGLRAELLYDLQAFAPELALCVGIVSLLILRLFRGLDRLHLGLVALGICVLALGLAWTQWNDDATLQRSAEQIVEVKSIFTGMLAYDNLTAYMRLLLFSFTALTIVLTLLTGIPDQEDSADFYTLLLGATLGMSLMTSSNHLLMVYIAVEMASLPSYALAGFLKGRRQSSEAALKYVVYGGAASGVMLYGISLLAGRFGTAYLPEVAVSFVTVLQKTSFDPVLLTGLMMILVGIGFKLAAVPFHFWCPDVFEGAAAEVAGFLSVASKAAAIALVGRFSLTMAGALPAGASFTPEQWKLVATYLGTALVFFAAVTTTFGNLAAYTQTNLKRLLAYSTIAQAGYILMAIAPLTREGLDAALFYLIAYLFMNLGAFAVVAFIRNRIGSEDLADYGGMIYRAPLLTVAMAIFLLSLIGIPPLMGYMGKFQIFAMLYDSSTKFHNTGLMVLLVIGLVNTVISLVYYARVLKVMIIDPVPEGASPARLRVPILQSIYTLLLAAVVIVGIFFWDPLADGSRKGVMQFKNIEPVKADKVAATP